MSKDEFNHDVITFGNSNNITLKANYKLYHTKDHTFELNGIYNRKVNNNYLTIFIEQDTGALLPNTSTLAQQNYILSTAKLGLTHSYQTVGINYSSKLNFTQGLNKQSKIDPEVPQNKEFTKYELEVNFSKRFETDFEPTYNFSFSGQSANRDLFATDEISFGGPYSVRGFAKGGLAGEKGFYIRNDFTLNHNISSFRLSPYLGLDYGQIIHFREISKREDITGGAIGFKGAYKDSSIDLFYHDGIIKAHKTDENPKGFFGFSLQQNF